MRNALVVSLVSGAAFGCRGGVDANDVRYLAGELDGYAAELPGIAGRNPQDRQSGRR